MYIHDQVSNGSVSYLSLKKIFISYYQLKYKHREIHLAQGLVLRK